MMDPKGSSLSRTSLVDNEEFRVFMAEVLHIKQ